MKEDLRQLIFELILMFLSIYALVNLKKQISNKTKNISMILNVVILCSIVVVIFLFIELLTIKINNP